MKIVIAYDASWRNSFLDPGTSNNEPLPKNGRKYVGSMTNLRKPENYSVRKVTIDTVMGLLNRLIGDQRKLYQSRSSDGYYFRDIEPKVKFLDTVEYVSTEVAYIRNITGSTDQNSYTGMIKVNDPIFTSDYAQELWSVLSMNLNALCKFIVADICCKRMMDLNPLEIIGRLDEIKKLKTESNDGDVLEAHTKISQHFEEFNGLNRKGEVFPISLYCSALYLQLERLEMKYDLSSARTEAGGLSGISKNGFTKKDFMSRYTTGEKKKIWGNPYMREEFVKGEGKTKHLLTKAGGRLEVNIDIAREQAKQIQNLIEFAGVSSFYLGKKGLAYVSDIRI